MLHNHRRWLEFESFHQCGWCGEWYVGARVDHGCPSHSDEVQINELAGEGEESPNYAAMSHGLPDGLIEHDDWREGGWM